MAENYLPIIGDKNRKAAMQLALEANLRRFLDQAIGIINESQDGKIPEEEAFKELGSMYENYARAIVEDFTR